MSTRCNIIVRDKDSQFTLYRHCDGYKEVTFEHLKDFIKTYNFTNNYYAQASSIVTELIRINLKKNTTDQDYNPYELTNGIHGDIEYLYTIDLELKTIRVENYGYLRDTSVCETFDYNKKEAK